MQEINRFLKNSISTINRFQVVDLSYIFRMEKLDELTDDFSANISVFNHIGDFLRDEDNRKCSLTMERLPQLVLICNKSLQYSQDKHVLLSVMRLLINLTADNDYNRRFLVEDTQLWRIVENLLITSDDKDVLERMVLFLNQFIYSDFKQKYLNLIFSKINFFNNLKIIENLTTNQSFTLFLQELILSNISTILQDLNRTCYIKLIDIYLLRLEFLVQGNLDQDEEAEEEVESIVDIIANLTLFEDLDTGSINANYRVITILNMIPNMTNITKVKRKLFATSGNITSMKNYHENAKVAIKLFESSTDPYALSATAISLGNYVTSVDRCEELLVIIENSYGLESFMRNFLNIQINDIIQIQMFYCLTKIINESNSSYIISNYEQLIKYSKLINDNYDYYVEVGKIYYKFIKKLINLQFVNGKQDMLQYLSIWKLTQDDEIKLLLLQSYCKNRIDTTSNQEETNFINDLITNSLNIDSQITLELILEKIKTLSIFFHKLNSCDTHLIESINQSEIFLKKLDQFLNKILEDIIPQAKNQPQYNIVVNNSRFLSISIMQSFEKNFKTTDNEKLISISTKCRELVDYEDHQKHLEQC